MNFITRPLKFIIALPFYAIATIALGAIMISARVIDRIYPESKTFVSFMRAILGFNTTQINMEDGEKATSKLGGFRIYK